MMILGIRITSVVGLHDDDSEVKKITSVVYVDYLVLMIIMPNLRVYVSSP